VGKQRYFIRVEDDTGREQMVGVNPVKLDLGTIQQLYILDPHGGKNQGSRYIPVSGGESIVKALLNTSSLNALIDEIFSGQLRVSLLASDDEEGKKVWKELEGIDLKGLLRAIATGQIAVAENTLRDILYTLMSCVCGLAGRLERETRTTSGMHLAVTAIAETMEVAGEVTESRYVEWADAARQLIRVVDELTVLERAFADFRTLVSEQYTLWQGLIGDITDPQVMRARAYLDGSSDEDGFLTRAFDYKRDSTSRTREEMTEFIRQAQVHLDACRAIEDDVASGFNELSNTRDTLVTKRSQLTRLITTLEETRRILQERERQMGSSVVRPYEFRDGALIVKTEYDHALTHLGSREWAPETCRKRIDGMLESALALLGNRPRLPKEILTILDDAEQRIREIEERWAREDGVPTAPPVSPAPHPKEDALLAQAGGSPSSTTATPAPVIDPRRVEELYELVICVGLIRTCTPQPVMGSTIHAMLGVVPFLGRCTPEEAVAYQASVVARSQFPGERETVDRTEHITPRWKQSGARWVSYRDPGRSAGKWKMKLTLAYRERVKALCAQRGLTEDEIRVAAKAHRATEVERYRLRKSARAAAGAEKPEDE